MRLKTSSSIMDVGRLGSTWYSRRGIHLLKLAGSMSETSRMLQIFSRLPTLLWRADQRETSKLVRCWSRVSGPRV